MERFASWACKWALAAGALLAVTGCGGTGDVTGKVSLNGTPLAGGIVTVYDSQQQNKSGLIMSDGTYTVAGVPLGQATITIVTSPPTLSPINPRNPPRAMWGPYTKIPKKYNDKNASGFGLDVKKGKQELDLAMTGDPDEGGAQGQ
jgi:hypothetical protein